MKFAQLMNDQTITAGSSARVGFGADNIQGIVVKMDPTASEVWNQVKINANVGSTFCIARCDLKQLNAINSYNSGTEPFHSTTSPADQVVYINLGSIYLDTNSEIEILVDNESTVDIELDIAVTYDGDLPPATITYQQLIDTNFARENCEQIWAFGTQLDEMEEVMTLQDSYGSQSTKVKVYNAFTNTQQNSGTYDTSSALVYSDDDDVLQKVTASITSLGNPSATPPEPHIDNFIVVCDDTTEEEAVESNKQFEAKKKAKFAALPFKLKKLNRLRGKI